tara:strand:- start:21 stop:239 length:219 start_codon:yes stop_codon:yes gene_type:complete
VLENKGFLVKEQDSKDKRITRLQITAPGDDLVKLLTPSPLLESYCQQAQPGEPEAIIDNLTSLLRNRPANPS